MASRFALLVRFFCYFPIPAGLEILQENPFVLLAFWSFYFPSHLETGRAEEWENEKNNGKGNRIAPNPPRDLPWIPHEGWGTDKLQLSQFGCTCPSKCNFRPAFSGGKLFGYEICWNIPKSTKLHLSLSFNTHAPSLEIFFVSKWKMGTLRFLL